MHNHCADLHVAGGGISPPKSPYAVERTFSLIRSPLPTHRTIVAHTVHFAPIFDLQFLIELIEQFRVHWISPTVRTAATPSAGIVVLGLPMGGRLDRCSPYMTRLVRACLILGPSRRRQANIDSAKMSTNDLPLV